MGISAAMVWEVRQAGSSSNGGGFRNNVAQAPPSAPAVSGSASGGTVAAGTYYVALTYTSASVETPISGETAVTTTGTTSSITVTHPSDPNSGLGGVTWNCYVATTSGGPYFPQGTTLAIGSNRSITATPPTSGVQPAGTDRTLSTSPFVAVDNATITATTAGANSNVLTFTAGYTPTGADVGNVFKAASGTNITAGWYEITAITSTTWTVTGPGNLTGSGGAGASIVGNMGGAVDHPASMGNYLAVGNIIFVQYSATAYTFSSAGSNVSGGTFTAGGSISLVGYSTTRSITNTDASRPIFRPSNNSLTLVTATGAADFRLANVDFDNPTPNTATTGVTTALRSEVRNCRFNTYQNSAVTLADGALAIDCEFISCGSGGAAVNITGNGACIRGLARSCTSSGLSNGTYSGAGNGASFIDCVAYASVGGGFNGGAYLEGCVAYGSTGGSGSGFFSGTTGRYERCVAYGNAVWGFHGTASRYSRLHRCYTGANSSGAINPAIFAADQLVACVTLSADPFTAPGSFDFSPNSISGGGIAIRGLTVALGGGQTTGYPDAGVAQHSDASIPQGPLGRTIVVQNIGTY